MPARNQDRALAHDRFGIDSDDDRALADSIQVEGINEPLTNNNRMEMIAALVALRSMPAGTQTTNYSDSTCVVNGMQAWRHAWRRRGWFKKSGEPVPDADLWQALDEHVGRVHSVFLSVRDHSGDRFNELADWLAARGLEGVASTRHGHG